MKKLTLSLIATLALTGLTFAQTTDEDRPRPPRPPQELVEQFDTDGDGRLNREERNALRESGQGRGQRPSREEVLQRFDADGDGQLNQAERNTAREARGQRGQRRGRGGRGGGGR